MVAEDRIPEDFELVQGNRTSKRYLLYALPLSALLIAACWLAARFWCPGGTNVTEERSLPMWHDVAAIKVTYLLGGFPKTVDATEPASIQDLLGCIGPAPDWDEPGGRAIGSNNLRISMKLRDETTRDYAVLCSEGGHLFLADLANLKYGRWRLRYMPTVLTTVPTEVLVRPFQEESVEYHLPTTRSAGRNRGEIGEK